MLKLTLFKFFVSVEFGNELLYDHKGCVFVDFMLIVHNLHACHKQIGYHHMNAEAHDQSEAVTPRSVN